jgi:hypothetical protein
MNVTTAMGNVALDLAPALGQEASYGYIDSVTFANSS